MLGNPRASPKISANQRQANMCFHVLNVKVSTFGKKYKLHTNTVCSKGFVLAKWRRFLAIATRNLPDFQWKILG